MITLIFLLVSSIYAATGTTQQNGNTYTYTQKVDENSPVEYYVAPSGYGFDQYSWYNQDYSWTHSFDDYNLENLNIISAKLTVVGWDVDSEPKHGVNGEYDGISINGVNLNPGLLQGTNNTWSTTVFDIPVESILDSGRFSVAVDIDMNHNSRTWATTLDYSQIEIIYTVEENTPPAPPIIQAAATTTSHASEDLVVEVVGPFPADEDNDPVTYNYRWFVDVGQGYSVDDEFANKEDNQGNRVSSEQINPGEIWSVEVTAKDTKQGISKKALQVFNVIHQDLDGDGIEDPLDEFPNNPSMSTTTYYPGEFTWNTLAFEDTWPSEGDFDLNDFVTNYRIKEYLNSNNEVTQIDYTLRLKARGGVTSNGFAFSINNTNSSNVDSIQSLLDGEIYPIDMEYDANSLIVIAIKDIKTILVSEGNYQFYNTELGDQQPYSEMVISIFLNSPLPQGYDLPPYNPFIFRTHSREQETHLIDYPPTPKHNKNLFNLYDDHSQINENKYYKTINGLPWAIDIPGDWEHPIEHEHLTDAYPSVLDWGKSNGKNSQSWYLNSSPGYVW